MVSLSVKGAVLVVCIVLTFAIFALGRMFLLLIFLVGFIFRFLVWERNLQSFAESCERVKGRNHGVKVLKEHFSFPRERNRILEDIQ